MENDTPYENRAQKFLDQIRPFITEEISYNLISSDFGDLMESFEWIVKRIAEIPSQPMNPLDVETLIIDIEVKFLDHTLHHINSIKSVIPRILDQFPDT